MFYLNYIKSCILLYFTSHQVDPKSTNNFQNRRFIFSYSPKPSSLSEVLILDMLFLFEGECFKAATKLQNYNERFLNAIVFFNEDKLFI